MSENDIPRLSPAIETSESIETAQDSEPVHSETPMLTSNAAPASPQALDASDASDGSTSRLDNIECEDQSFADILKQNEQKIEPNEEPSETETSLDAMMIEPKETPEVVPSQPTSTNTTPVQPAGQPEVYGTLMCKFSRVFVLSFDRFFDFGPSSCGPHLALAIRKSCLSNYKGHNRHWYVLSFSGD